MTKLCLSRSEDMDKRHEGLVGIQKDHVNGGRIVVSRMCLGGGSWHLRAARGCNRRWWGHL